MCYEKFGMFFLGIDYVLFVFVNKVYIERVCLLGVFVDNFGNVIVGLGMLFLNIIVIDLKIECKYKIYFEKL